MQMRRTYRSPAAPAVYLVIGLTLIGAYVSIMVLLIDRTPYDVWGAWLLAPVLIGLSVPALRRQGLREEDPGTFRILVLALVLKLAGAVVRYHVAFSVYGGVADAARYHTAGVSLAGNFRQLDFSAVHLVAGTSFMETVTGLMYAVIGDSKMGGFVFYSWLGFWGLFLFYRAFILAVPLGRRRSYAHLLFFLPSLVFWPSGIGKEAWMMFSLGLAAYGVARVFSRSIGRGLVCFGSGVWLAGMVRPHIAGLVAVSLAAAVITRKNGAGLRELAPVLKGGSIIAVAIFAAVLVVRTDRFLEESGIDTSGGVSSTLTDVQGRTSEGGSEFSASIVDSPSRAPLATITVLFRPLIFEAHNFQSLLAAVEGTLLLILCLIRVPWIWASVKSMREQPYVVFCVVFSILFIVAYSSYANFGLLVRQRVQLYPLFLVLLAIPPLGVRRRDAGSAERVSAIT